MGLKLGEAGREVNGHDGETLVDWRKGGGKWAG